MRHTYTVHILAQKKGDPDQHGLFLSTRAESLKDAAIKAKTRGHAEGWHLVKVLRVEKEHTTLGPVFENPMGPKAETALYAGLGTIGALVILRLLSRTLT